MIKKYVLGFTVVLTLVFGGLMLQGCPQVSDDGTVEVKVPYVKLVSESVQNGAAYLKIFYPDSAVEGANLLNNIANTLETAEGDLPKLIMETTDQAIEAGKVPDQYKTFILGVVTIADSYLKFADFNVDDVIIIFRSAAKSLGSEASVQAAGWAGWNKLD